MAQEKSFSVELIGTTQFFTPSDMEWETDANGGSALVEFAGRACYETFNKPNPRTANNTAFLSHLKEVGHLAVFEHASASFYIRGMSHTAAHELMRHRNLSFSQLSPRYVEEPEIPIIVPEIIAESEELKSIFLRAADDAQCVYEQLKERLEQELAHSDDPLYKNSLLDEKKIRQAAREILPHAQETRLIVSGHYRAWRHVIAMRGSEQVNREIRTIIIAILKELKKVAPACFEDFDINILRDGSEIAVSPYVTEF